MWTNNSIDDLIIGVMRHGPGVLEYATSKDPLLQQYIETVDRERLDYPTPSAIVDTNDWFIPKEYKELDIEEYLVNQCPTENYQRLITELQLYRSHNMMPVLRTMKYIVDTLRKNNVVWGVGRGSSVSSYVLFLLGVHKIDSVKYDLPIEEFFKGETNG